MAGALVDRYGERPFMVTGLLLQGIGMGWIALIADPGMAYGELIAPLIIAGCGGSMTFPAAQNSVVGSVPLEAVGKAAGANSMMRELGGVFGIAILVAVFAGAGSYASPEEFHRRVRAGARGDGGPVVPRGARGARPARAATHRRGPPTARARNRRRHPMSSAMVRYRVKPAEAAHNEELMRAVFAELADARPAGLRYASFALKDGVTFVHVASEPDDGRRPLQETAAFKAFRKQLRDRCDEPPQVTRLREVGSYIGGA